jgi:hypothetical protein
VSPLTLFLVAEGALIMCIGGIVVAVMAGDFVVRAVRRKVGR